MLLLLLVIDYKKPWQQGKVEGFHLSMKIEVKNRLLIKTRWIFRLVVHDIVTAIYS